MDSLINVVTLQQTVVAVETSLVYVSGNVSQHAASIGKTVAALATNPSLPSENSLISSAQLNSAIQSTASTSSTQLASFMNSTTFALSTLVLKSDYNAFVASITSQLQNFTTNTTASLATLVLKSDFAAFQTINNNNIAAKASQTDFNKVLAALSLASDANNLVNVPALQALQNTNIVTISALLNAASSTNPSNQNFLWNVTSLAARIAVLESSSSTLFATTTSFNNTINVHTATLSTKANQVDLTTLSGQVNGTQAAINTQGLSISGINSQLTAQLSTIATKANQVDLTTLMSRVGTDEATISSQGISITSVTSRMTAAESNIVAASSSIYWSGLQINAEVNLIDSPDFTGNFSRWSTSPSVGIVDAAWFDSRSIRAFKSLQDTSGTSSTCYNWAYSNLIAVDPGRSYEFGIWIKSTTTAMSNYMGFTVFDSSKNVIGGLWANPYIKSSSSDSTNWKYHNGFLLSSNSVTFLGSTTYEFEFLCFGLSLF